MVVGECFKGVGIQQSMPLLVVLVLGMAVGAVGEDDWDWNSLTDAVEGVVGAVADTTASAVNATDTVGTMMGTHGAAAAHAGAEAAAMGLLGVELTEALVLLEQLSYSVFVLSSFAVSLALGLGTLPPALFHLAIVAVGLEQTARLTIAALKVVLPLTVAYPGTFVCLVALGSRLGTVGALLWRGASRLCRRRRPDPDAVTRQQLQADIGKIAGQLTALAVVIERAPIAPHPHVKTE
eukprot:m.270472 g.270472  ORF g.270472 m.270472 type:complete len:237 (+) comp16080_c0_seq4:48-758(+)